MPERSAVRLVLAALAAALLLVACSDRVPPPSTPTATRSPRPATPTASPTPAPDVPDFLRGVDIRPLQIDFDADVTNVTGLIIELGCTQCDGPTTGFARVYGTPYSASRFDVLLTPEMLPLPPAAPEDQRYVAGFGFAPDGSDLIAGVCVRGYCGGMGSPTSDAEVWLFRSTDGGITWSDFEHLPRPEFVAGWLGPGSVLTTYIDGGGRQYFTARPSGQTVTPPANAPNAWPMVIADRNVLWQTDDGLLRSDGSIYAWTDQSEVSFGKPLVSNRGGLIPLSWTRGTESKYYLAQRRPDGSVLRAFSADGWIFPEAWMSPVSNARIFASVPVPTSRYPAPSGRQFVGSLPAIIVLGSAAVLPISDPFLNGPFFNGRNHVVAVQQGPLARVEDTGDCLNVRDAPSTSGNILDCLADGVLVRDSADVSQADGMTWAHVTTPAGVEGWVSTEYLER